MVVNVEARGPAAEAGLKRGDVIQAVDGQAVDDPEGVGFRLGAKPLGGSAALEVLRNGKAQALQLSLSAAPEEPPRDAIRLKARSPLEGALARNLSPAVREELSLNEAHEGVVIADVREDSLAASFGVQKGDVILSVNGQKIASTRDLDAACAARVREWDVSISRAGQIINSRIGN